MSKRKRFFLYFPWAGLTASLITIPLHLGREWPFWQAVALTMALTIPLSIVQSAITATIKGGTGIWSDAAQRWRDSR